MKKKLLALCMSAAIAASIPGMAVTVQATETTEATETTTVEMKTVSFENGLLTASIPADESWQEISDDASCITISDGSNTIIFNHYSTPDELPVVASYDSQHEMAFEIAYSKSDISVTLVGKITHTDDYATVRKIMESINIDVTKIDSSHPTTHKASTDSYTVNEVNYTAWVKAVDGLCIRDSASTSGNYVASAAYADTVTVIGEVMNNGSDTGWRKVTLSDGTTGFCAGEFLTTTEITVKDPTKNRDSYTSDPNYPQCVVVYCAGDLRTIYLMENGDYVDDNGDIYDVQDENFTTFVRASDGLVYTQADAAGIDASSFVNEDDSAEITVTNDAGETRTLRHTTTNVDGEYSDEYGNNFVQTDAGVWQCEDGTMYYE